MSNAAIVDVFSDVYEYEDNESVFGDVFQFDEVPATVIISGQPIPLQGTSVRYIRLQGTGKFPVSAMGTSASSIRLRGIRYAR